MCLECFVMLVMNLDSACDVRDKLWMCSITCSLLFGYCIITSRICLIRCLILFFDRVVTVVDFT